MSKADNWMPLYLGDYMSDTMHLNGAQHGAYLLLLMHYWRNGPLPNDDGQLAAIARTEQKAWKAMAPVIRAFFRLIDGALHQKRMDKERDRWFDISSKRRDAGRAGAIAKHNTSKPPDKPPGNGVANARDLPAENWQMPAVCQDFATTPLPTPSKNLNSLGEDTRAREPAMAADAVGPEAAQAVVVSLQKSQRMKAYPPRAPQLSAAQQIEEVAPSRPKTAHLSPQQLAIVRQQLNRRRA